ncbi:cholesterol esterase [Streptomyces lunaelactis]|uniref:Cholesterol esterase n=1 Tax=Streptomyces lunaelactis TaxID=1535768 RepID=A0A2R4T899_9ACTN|nr:DUF6230 family protein [Streptomyces lunaelactis]AVZ75363.1 cholesterol esterase [Streptomyces lunaelactis]NUK03452.1 cholesterol esterase [Streptomyces lunaelactis]NUK09870.1 cholesterol esterase [Streptomyces lunaelactis]NUK17342.1 cholesterol esterase [Streptomyces lunaelactis]NUK26065.1 cholesterol esterase [Streptomyces lunaelactis]
MESLARGGTRWKRFALVMVPSVAATAAIGIGLAQGALAASFAVSGQEFKVTAGHLDGRGFAQYGGVDMGYADLKGDAKTAHPVAISTFKNATINNMCQSVVTDVPFVGKITLKLKAGEGKTPVSAENLYLDVSQLDADATFENIDIGVAAKDTDNPGTGKGPAVKDKSILENGFAQQADRAILDNVEQKAWATTAGTFKLSGLKMRLLKGSGDGVECF